MCRSRSKAEAIRAMPAAERPSLPLLPSWGNAGALASMCHLGMAIERAYPPKVAPRAVCRLFLPSPACLRTADGERKERAACLAVGEGLKRNYGLHKNIHFTEGP